MLVVGGLFIYFLVILFSWMLRAMLVVRSNHYFYWMYLFLLPSLLPSFLLSFFFFLSPVFSVKASWRCGPQGLLCLEISLWLLVFFIPVIPSTWRRVKGLAWTWLILGSPGKHFFCVDHHFVYDTVYKIPDGVSHVLPE